MVQQLDLLAWEPNLDLSRDFKFKIRSNSYTCKKKRLEDKFPKDGAWKCFNFIYDNFPNLRWLNKRLQHDRKAPTLEYARKYLTQHFPDDPHIEELTPKKAVLIATYLAIYEHLVPAWDPEKKTESFNSNDYFVHSIERFKKYFPLQSSLWE